MAKQKFNRTELVEQLEEARDLMREAHTLLDQAARALNDRHAQAYVVDHLAILIDSEHGFLSRDFNVQEWIEQVENDKDGYADEEDECDDNE